MNANMADVMMLMALPLQSLRNVKIMRIDKYLLQRGADGMYPYVFTFLILCKFLDQSQFAIVGNLLQEDAPSNS